MHTREDEIFMLIKGEALLWLGEERMELSEGGIVYLPKNIPHGYRITSDTADLLMITTPGGIEGMFQQAGRDVTTPGPRTSSSRPRGWPKSPTPTDRSSSARRAESHARRQYRLPAALPSLYNPLRRSLVSPLDP